MTLIELRNKISDILDEHPSWSGVDRIGIVLDRDESGECSMEWLRDFTTISCDGQGMVAFRLVMDGNNDYNE